MHKPSENEVCKLANLSHNWFNSILHKTMIIQKSCITMRQDHENVYAHLGQTKLEGKMPIANHIFV